jgi:hypothetical protein
MAAEGKGGKYVLTFVDKGRGEVPAAHRLRSLLKHALRALGFQCVDAREVGGEGDRPRAGRADAGGPP